MDDSSNESNVVDWTNVADEQTNDVPSIIATPPMSNGSHERKEHTVFEQVALMMGMPTKSTREKKLRPEVVNLLKEHKLRGLHELRSLHLHLSSSMK